jgi:hypothetical protein
MVYQMPFKANKIVNIAIALCGAYIILSIIFNYTDTSFLSPKPPRYNREGINDAALDHISNTTLGVRTISDMPKSYLHTDESY